MKPYFLFDFTSGGGGGGGGWGGLLNETNKQKNIHSEHYNTPLLSPTERERKRERERERLVLENLNTLA